MDLDTNSKTSHADASKTMLTEFDAGKNVEAHVHPNHFLGSLSTGRVNPSQVARATSLTILSPQERYFSSFASNTQPTMTPGVYPTVHNHNIANHHVCATTFRTSLPTTTTKSYPASSCFISTPAPVIPQQQHPPEKGTFEALTETAQVDLIMRCRRLKHSKAEDFADCIEYRATIDRRLRIRDEIAAWVIHGVAKIRLEKEAATTFKYIREKAEMDSAGDFGQMEDREKEAREYWLACGLAEDDFVKGGVTLERYVNARASVSVPTLGNETLNSSDMVVTIPRSCIVASLQSPVRIAWVHKHRGQCLIYTAPRKEGEGRGERQCYYDRARRLLC